MEVIRDIVAVKPMNGYKLDVEFDNGEKGVVARSACKFIASALPVRFVIFG